MIIFDYSAIFHMNLNQQLKFGKGVFQPALLRHMVLSSILVALSKNKEEANDIVIACDDRHYWRKEFFTEYKAGRKESRSSDGKNWDEIFDAMNSFKNEMREYFPYRVIQAENAEADDVIAHLVQTHASKTNIVIVSPDKDLLQLQTYENVAIYDPKKKHHVICDDPLGELHKLILSGDKSDGIPNFLSPDDSFVSGKRQKAISKELLEFVEDLDETTFCPTMMNRFPDSYLMRNIKCIDLNYIPNYIREEIDKQYEVEPSDGSKLVEYFQKYKLKKLSERIEEF